MLRGAAGLNGTISKFFKSPNLMKAVKMKPSGTARLLLVRWSILDLHTPKKRSAYFDLLEQMLQSWTL